MATDLRELPRNDQGVLAAGVLVFIASFFPFYGASVHAAGIGASTSVTSWHSYATLAVILLLAATVAAAAQLFAAESLPTLPVSWNVVVAALSALGTLLYILRAFTLDSGSALGFDYGLRWGAYVVMVLAIAQTAFAVIRLRESGETMPWQHHGPAAPPVA